MVNTKVTKRKAIRSCPMCSATFQGDSEFSKHVVECAMKDHITSQKASNVKRHMKRAHKGMIETPLPPRGQSTPNKK